ncbi:1-acyl-sn-glycerol-3-phosphate acyltransferase alpha isoform X1 [Zootermopsis nevadensis]|uniref:1-acyl-sn-glycerol-3-phosphate acyltransferase n=1 Tax=Zootermopsis nevadensis TaxID=136037 RepID=A0A067R1X9_ZOONE|nr:1-acyl-sn-glycerol-3-phosphate acyltransferase alpha isoform X1 [Zootermopsis nevadensis]KDR16862.1 1-acyl-sn-glycerol-3-phosphate acyltransferase alpha [Zootermopsis nevadensis]
MLPSSLELVLVVFILILPFLYETSRAFRYYIKFFLYYGIVMTTAVVVIPIMMFRPKDVKNLLLASALCRHISGLLGLKWELRGQEHLEKEQACIIVANHQSSLDILGMFDIWPVMDKCTVVAKKELFYAWPFGLAAWLCGLIFIDRLNSDKARATINRATTLIKEKKMKMWVFPEGTRNNTGNILPFKKGAFHVAIAAQVPVLPVIFSSYYFLDNNNKQFDSGNIIITTLPPIKTEGLCKNDVEDLMNRTRAIMLEAFTITSKEVQAAALMKTATY